MYTAGSGKGVGTGMELQRVHNLSLLVRQVCSLCCRGLAWLLWWWGGLKKAGVSCWLGRLILGFLCGCNYVEVEIPPDDFPLERERSSVARRVKTGGD